MPTDLPAQPNQSLIHGLECLQAVVAAGQPVGGRDLARSLGIEPTKVNRLLKTLAHLHLLERTPRAKYRPGPGVHVLAALSLQGSHLITATLPHARRYWEEGYTLTLGVLWRQYLCYLLHARPGTNFDRAIGGHELMTATHSSAGLVLLAHQPPEVVRGWTFEQGERLVEPVGKLAEQLAEVRAAGYGVRHYADGVVSVGVPIDAPPVAAFAASRPGLSQKDVAALAERLRGTAEEIRKAYGQN